MAVFVCFLNKKADSFKHKKILKYQVVYSDKGKPQ